MADFQIGRLQAALANATNEVTVAAANINFDFCLVKYEAPQEYRPLGSLLSMKRKQNAESGSSHVTARRLAALFQDLCPDTPMLIKAYGQRVSDISKAAMDKEPTHFAHSMFSSYAGIDATSIWAAATSSNTNKRGALHMHLLASMLARMWPQPEAVSIWDELVRERRQFIADRLKNGDSLPFSLATAAAQQEISRAQLAEWDTSARAWLQTADSIMELQQTQIRLILKNIEMSVDRGSCLYSGVVEAWVKALTIMERLVSGVPQEIHDGAALLGLSAWHIYPDLRVFGPRTIDVPMKDSLVNAGGVVTLGCSPSATTPSTGITWSLSLSHLKFYGQPVESLGSLQSDPARLTFHELTLVALGCIVRLWDLSLEQIPLVAKVVSAMIKAMERQDPRQGMIPGLKCLEEACQRYIEDPANASIFVNLGINRPRFIPDQASHIPMTTLRPLFGFLDDDNFISHLKDAEARIAFLRRVAKRSPDDESIGSRCVIRCKDEGAQGSEAIVWASVFPTVPLGGPRRTRKQAKIHHRRNTTKTSRKPAELYCHDCVCFKDNGATVTRTSRDLSVLMMPWYGARSALIYMDYEPSKPAISRPSIVVDDVIWALDNDFLNVHIPEDAASLSFQALDDAYNLVFRRLPGSIIQLSSLSRSLFEARWARARHGDRKGSENNSKAHNNSDTHTTHSTLRGGGSGKGDLRSREIRLTIIILSYFISGADSWIEDIPGTVCGISMGDSIYIPEQMISDPFHPCDYGAFVRVLGNIGRPGMVMFSSVDHPVVAPSDEMSWRVINRNRFDGKPYDAFQTTSMHLAFTDWERSIASDDTKGVRDAQLFLMESVVSIRDAGRWIGDVDIIRALRDERISRLRPQAACHHTERDSSETRMISVETWDELRESHSGNVVIRAHGNWAARLAIAAYLSQQSRQGGPFQVENIILCPENMCWKCTENYRACVYIY